MTQSRYAWLQDSLAELVRHAMEAQLYTVSKHLSSALQAVREAAGGHDSAAAVRSERTTVLLALEDCHIMLTDLGETAAAADVAQAMAQLSQDQRQAPITTPTPRTDRD
ncbi:hypothetical protein [Pseudodonghicola xiamenensis]|uniref:Uncharacterized protein n=1 Tax=Pseudodonghicola xiamenensis TaxID=337702 RepID=A0A8J3H7P4_9RHOB|nr:hypothetical protein [Pseudodonghicola xiamenensis]GHG88295.1 hypothetical protein GCM10010961_17240 [Pseudodonghicola xiamenensis]